MIGEFFPFGFRRNSVLGGVLLQFFGEGKIRRKRAAGSRSRRGGVFCRARMRDAKRRAPSYSNLRCFKKLFRNGTCLLWMWLLTCQSRAIGLAIGLGIALPFCFSSTAPALGEPFVPFCPSQQLPVSALIVVLSIEQFEIRFEYKLCCVLLFSRARPADLIDPLDVPVERLAVRIVMIQQEEIASVLFDRQFLCVPQVIAGVPRVPLVAHTFTASGCKPA